jgi:hypothetical protein
MLKNRIRLNGVDYTENATNLQELVVKYVLNSQDATVTYSLSKDKLTFSGPAADLVRTLLTNPFDTIDVAIDLHCCDETLTYIIVSKAVSDCGANTVEAQLVTETVESEAYQVLNRTIIIKNAESDFVQWLIATGRNYRMEYCNEPDSTGYIVLVLYLLVFPLLTVLNTTLELIFDQRFKDLDRWELTALGCGRYWTVFTVNDMLTYYAAKAGVGYVSSIIQNLPYKNMVVVDGSNGQGVYVDLIVDWHNRNIFNLTVTQFLEILAPVFHAQYRIINGVLRIETDKWFADNAFKVADYEYDDVACYCYALDPDQFKAFGRYQFENDSMDSAGNQAAEDYNDIVEWNDPVQKALKGEHTTTVKFAPARHVSDRHRDTFINHFRYTNTNGPRRHELVVSQGQLEVLKLIIIDPVTIIRNYFVQAKPTLVHSDLYDYNRDLKFDQMATFDELYKRFHYLDDPRERIIGEIEKIEAKLNICNLVNHIKNNGMNVYVRTQYGKAIPEEVEIDTGTGIVTFKNCRVWL